MDDAIRLDGITLGAPDALELATFYARLTGGVAAGVPQWAVVHGPHGVLSFQQVRDFQPPTWPDGHRPALLHLDFLVDDLEAAGARAVEAGATRFETQPNADHCIVYADPVGHPFCPHHLEHRLARPGPVGRGRCAGRPTRVRLVTDRAVCK